MENQSSVLLGIPDGIIVSQDDLRNGWTTDSTNKFGGTPNWIKEGPVEHPQCTLCNTTLPLVSQIYCPLVNSLYHRVVYVFGCANVSCWNKKESWIVLRCQSLAENVHEAEDKTIGVKDSWCHEADEWGGEDEEPATENSSGLEHLERQTRDLTLSEGVPTTGPLNDLCCHNRGKKDTVAPVTFIPYYVTVIEELTLTSGAKIPSRYEKKLMAEYQRREGLTDFEEMMEGRACTREGWGGEKYELSVAKHGDKSFNKFQKQLSLCPQQCLRYSWNGEPLLMSSQCLGKIPVCSYCGQRRVFEMQLMPALVSLLQTHRKSFSKTRTSNDNTSDNLVEDHKDNLTQLEFSQFKGEAISGLGNIEFGTIFIYTCSQSCWSDVEPFREEYAIVHSDPDQHLFKL